MKFALSSPVLVLLVQTVEMSIVGSVVGTLISITLAWFGAWNVTPSRFFLYPLARLGIVLGRAIPSMMWGLVLVAVLGFGPLPGIIALAVGSIGFAGKLMAEQVEAIDMKPIEAMRATGAGHVLVFVYGVIPQIKPSWAGIFIYNWDARLRSSTILGFVGAGGIGLALREQISTMNYHTAIGIIFLIIVLVVFSEALSHYVRRYFA
jgi:phosphonate transport system permease protein